jgi:DNA-binding response OmpR family regulator
MAMEAAKILSLSYSADKLELRELALRAQGFEVKSVLSPGQARYEIEMGGYTIFLTCADVPDIVNQDLMNLFRRSCGEEGLIILIEGDGVTSKTLYPLPADVRIPKALDPDGIIQALRERRRSPRASTE